MQQTRRRFLAATAGAAVLGTAGCLGNGGDSQSDGEDPIASLGCSIEEREPVDSLPTPTMGPDDAPVVVDAWEDFACPHCATFSLEVLPQVESEYVADGVVQYRHHDFPLPVKEWWSWKGASAARAAQDEADDETFFAFAHTLFENQSTFGGNDTQASLSTLRDLANDAGLDGCSVAAAASRDRYRPLLESQRTDAVENRGFQGTPAVLVNGEQVPPRWEDLKSAIENAR
ncbi:DsbA family protein [Haloferax larsenii]|uniref:DsbA family protein n=1 Tax=Haloferax larsenii TaxID=302484 RepID=A0ABY5RE33_HALLR|nr:DsbA family protein [Haloferax larsenii]UVE49430.1 DsbA family protein [Haloferax larsenii]